MPNQIDRDELQRLRHRGATILEVLPRDEFDHEHLPAALNLPLDELTANTAQRVIGTDKQRPLVVYCQSVE